MPSAADSRKRCWLHDTAAHGRFGRLTPAPAPCPMPQVTETEQDGHRDPGREQRHRHGDLLSSETERAPGPHPPQTRGGHRHRRRVTPTRASSSWRAKGTGAFCAGASFDELRGLTTADEGKEFFSGFARVILAMRRNPKIIIGRIQGKAVGGGVGLVAATDYSFALDGASVRLSELAVGLGPFVVGPVIERRIGRAAFAAMSIDADWRDCAWAEQYGLYTRVMDTEPALDAVLPAFANRLVQPESRRAHAAQARALGRDQPLGDAAVRTRGHQRQARDVGVHQARGRAVGAIHAPNANPRAPRLLIRVWPSGSHRELRGGSTKAAHAETRSWSRIGLAS